MVSKKSDKVATVPKTLLFGSYECQIQDLRLTNLLDSVRSDRGQNFCNAHRDTYSAIVLYARIPASYFEAISVDNLLFLDKKKPRLLMKGILRYLFLV